MTCLLGDPVSKATIRRVGRLDSLAKHAERVWRQPLTSGNITHAEQANKKAKKKEEKKTDPGRRRTSMVAVSHSRAWRAHRSDAYMCRCGKELIKHAWGKLSRKRAPRSFLLSVLRALARCGRFARFCRRVAVNLGGQHFTSRRQKTTSAVCLLAGHGQHSDDSCAEVPHAVVRRHLAASWVLHDSKNCTLKEVTCML